MAILYHKSKYTSTYKLHKKIHVDLYILRIAMYIDVCYIILTGNKEARSQPETAATRVLKHPTTTQSLTGPLLGEVKVDKVAPAIAAQAVKTAGYGQGYGEKPSEIRIPEKSGKQDKRE